MAKSIELTESQKIRLERLELKLKEYAKGGDYQKAKEVYTDIRSILLDRDQTRLYKNKNYLFEAAMEDGEIDFAQEGFTITREKVSKNTRIRLEATTLLAVCFLRKGDFEKAKPLIQEVLRDEKSIKSIVGRKEFRRRVINRFDEEGTLASLRGVESDLMDSASIQNEAGKLVERMTEDEIYEEFGNGIPEHTIKYLRELETFSQKQLPFEERKLLPSPEERATRREAAKTVFSSVKRVLWRSLCDKESEIYKVWYNQGMGIVLSNKYLSGAVVAALTGLGIGINAIAISATALVIKFGIEVYCDRFKPEDIMTAREIRKTKKRSR